MSEAGIEYRLLTERCQLQDAVALQKTVWGFDDIDLLPLRLFVVASKIGGHTFGAYDGDRMVAFCLAIPGIKPGGGNFLHSHMLGVLPEYHNRGIGRRLKLKQREEALSRGIRLMEWTFDPLEIKNAYFNMERLGAIVRRYVENQYGVSSSPLHAGLPTDRCVAEWWMDSPRVENVLARRAPERRIEARIELPADIAEIRHHDPRRARLIQEAMCTQFRAVFDAGLAVTGFELTKEKAIYLLGPYEN